MKGLRTSFLFFYLLLFSLNNLSAQELIDSLKYYSNIIRAPKNSGDLSSAYLFFMNRKDSSIEKKEIEKVIYYYIQIARVENKLGEIYNSENSIIEALKLLDELKENDWILRNKITIFNHLGILNKRQLKYSEALKNYDSVLSITTKDVDIAKAYGNKGNVYSKQGYYDKAIKEYRKALKISLKKGRPKMEARFKDNLGLAQSKLNLPEALNNMLDALKIRKEKKFTQGIITSYLNLTEYYSDRESLNKAKLYAKLALTIADSSNILDYRLESLASVLKLNQDEKFKEFLILNDGLKTNELLNNKKYAEAKYNYNKQSKRADLNKLNAERQKRFKLLYLSIAAFIIFLSIFLYTILKVRHKKEKLQQVYNTEKRISKKVHDEVANDVFQIMTKLQSEPAINENVIDDLDHIYSKTRDIAKEHAVLDYDGDFEQVLHDLLLSYNSNTVNVISKAITKVNWESISKIKKETIYKVLQEFMINMTKHSKASIAVLTFNETRKKIKITYKDNGVGCKLKKNTGLQNVENRIESINGTFIFESEINNGFKAEITV